MSAPLARVSDIATQIRGVTYGKSDASKSPLEGYLPVLRAGNITDDGLIYDDLVYVPAGRISKKQMIRQHDVVIAASSGSLSIVGKAAASLTDFDGGFGAFCKVLRPSAKVDAKYFAQFFKTSDYRRRISALAAGANINNLRSEHLDEMQIPLPSLAEQRRIAEVLDRAEALRAKRRAALAQLDSLTQSIFLDMFGDPTANPKGWLKKPFAFLMADETSRSMKLPQANFDKEGAYPVIDQGQSSIAGYCKDSTYLCTSKLPTVIFGDHTRTVKFVDHPFVIGADGAKVLAPSREVHAWYLCWLLRMSPIPNLGYSRHMREVKRLRYMVPPLALQETFAHRITAIETLKTTHHAALAALDALFASLQHRAFRGEL